MKRGLPPGRGSLLLVAVVGFCSLLQESPILLPVFAQGSNQLCQVEPVDSSRMLRCDASLLDSRLSPEWLKLKKIEDRLRDYSAENASCYYPEIEMNLSFYVGLPVRGAKINGDTPVRIFGSRQLFTAGSAAERLQSIGYPPEGMITLDRVFDDEEDLEVFLSSLAQLKLVYVPRITSGTSKEEEGGTCFNIFSATLVPDRVFNAELPWRTEGVGPPPQYLPFDASGISLEKKRETLERLAVESNWIKRLSLERTPCGEDEDQYTELQVLELEEEILPEKKFLIRCSEFWANVESRVDQLKQWDKKKIENRKRAAMTR